MCLVSIAYLSLSFLAVLGLCCFEQAFSSCGQGLLYIAVHRLLIVVASLVAEQSSRACGLQSLQHTGSVVAAHGPSSMRAFSRYSTWTL